MNIQGVWSARATQSEGRWHPIFFAFLVLSLVTAWQWATVTANFGGNWTALFSTGGLQHRPSSVAFEHTYIFADSAGFDGQFYRYVAHDPAMRSDLKSYIDDPALRYRRILIPALAFIISLEHSQWIDTAYELVILT